MHDFRYTPRDLCMNSETYHYKRGANQQFSQVSHTFDPSQYLEEELTYNPDRDVIPIAIHCVAEEGGEGNKYGKKKYLNTGGHPLPYFILNMICI